MKICKAIKFNLCVGSGEVSDKRKGEYCTDECRNAGVKYLTKKKIFSSAISSSGCNLTSTSSNSRCRYADKCKHYSECLGLMFNSTGNGFKSDEKGFEPIEKNKNDGWNDTGDYTVDHTVHI